MKKLGVVAVALLMVGVAGGQDEAAKKDLKFMEGTWVVTLEEMGGARMHCTVSGLGDFLAESEEDAIRIARDYFRYMPHLTVITQGGSCSIDRNRNINCSSGDIIYRQMSFNTDPAVPATMRGFQDEFWTQWYIVTEPEQMRYTASLTIAYADMQRPEDLYAFIPSLRRYQPDDLLPESDGLTAGRLTETLTSITDSGNAP